MPPARPPPTEEDRCSESVVFTAPDLSDTGEATDPATVLNHRFFSFSFIMTSVPAVVAHNCATTVL